MKGQEHREKHRRAGSATRSVQPVRYGSGYFCRSTKSTQIIALVNVTANELRCPRKTMFHTI